MHCMESLLCRVNHLMYSSSTFVCVCVFSDYTVQGTTYTFSQTVLRQCTTIQTVDDTTSEPPETLSLIMRPSEEAILVENQSSTNVTIIDNDLRKWFCTSVLPALSHPSPSWITAVNLTISSFSLVCSVHGWWGSTGGGSNWKRGKGGDLFWPSLGDSVW